MAKGTDPEGCVLGMEILHAARYPTRKLCDLSTPALVLLRKLLANSTKCVERQGMSAESDE